MTWTSKSLTLTGLIFLAHACYSAHEHAALLSTQGPHAPSRDQQLDTSLPTDIRIETIAATLLLCLGLILGSDKPRPIRWDVWAGKIEREGDAGFPDAAGNVDEEYRGNPFEALESRSGFVDIRKLRREFEQREFGHGSHGAGGGGGE